MDPSGFTATGGPAPIEEVVLVESRTNYHRHGNFGVLLGTIGYGGGGGGADGSPGGGGLGPGGGPNRSHQSSNGQEEDDTNACGDTAICTATINGPEVVMTAYPNINDWGTITIGDTLILAGGIAGPLAPAIKLGTVSYIRAFGLQQFGQPFRHARVAQLAKLLDPVSKFAGKLGWVGAGFEIVGSTYVGHETGNWMPLFVSITATGVGAVVGVTLGLPAAIGFAAAYSVAHYFGVFDPVSYP